MDAVLITLAFLVWYWYLAQAAPVDLRICGGCDDLIYVPLRVIARCPTCKRLGVWE